MTDAKSLKPIFMTNDGIANDELKIISCNCTTDCKTNRCGCKKIIYPVHYIEKRIVLKEMLYATV